MDLQAMLFVIPVIALLSVGQILAILLLHRKGKLTPFSIALTIALLNVSIALALGIFGKVPIQILAILVFPTGLAIFVLAWIISRTLFSQFFKR